MKNKSYSIIFGSFALFIFIGGLFFNFFWYTMWFTMAFILVCRLAKFAKETLDEEPISLKLFDNLYNFLPSKMYYLFLLRVPIVSGLILFLFPFIAQFITPNFLKNIFVTENGVQLILVIVFFALTAITVVSLLKTILVLIPNESFNNNESFRFGRLVGTFFLFLPTWSLLLMNKEASIEWAYPFFGIAISMTLFLMTEIYEYKMMILTLANYISKKNISSPKIFSEETLKRRRIVFFIIQMLSGLLFYGLVIFFNWPRNQSDSILPKDLQAPTLLYVLLMIWVLTLFVGLVTFLLDKSIDDQLDEDKNKTSSLYQHTFYWPVILILIVFSGLGYGVWGVDHFFKLEDSQVIIADYQQDFQQAIWNRLCEEKFDISQTQICNKDKEQSLVVVAASGGGIQASGWMAQILAGLQDQDLGIGEDFIKSIGLISSTSGGSVGSMFYLDKFQNGVLSNKGLIKQGNNGLTKVVENSTDDWLNSVGWGLAFPDLFRAIGLPFVISWFSEDYKYLDRGYALEKNWQKALTLVNNKPPTLDDRREQTLGGKIPIAVYNTTLVENGRPFLVSSMKFVPGIMADYANESSQQTVNNTALDFKTLYNNCGTNSDQSCDLALTTAVRLSASFPYVTPMARNDRENIIKVNNKDGEKNILQNYHVADGGYYDNAGGFTAMNWLNNFLEYNNSKKNKGHRINIKKVMILQINAFPEDNLKLDQLGSPGFIVSTIGPLNTLAGIRDSTQIGRNKIFAELLKARWNNDKNDQNNIEIQDFTISFPPKDPDGRDYNPPLSWRLTQAQKQNLVEAWENNANIRNTVEKMKAFWNFSDGHK